MSRQVIPRRYASALLAAVDAAGLPVAAALAFGGQFLLSLKRLGTAGSVVAGAALYAAAFALLVLTLLRERRRGTDGAAPEVGLGRPAWLSPGVEWALLAVVLAGGLYLRLYRIDIIPPGLNNDEAINALEVKDIRAGRPFESLTERGLDRETMFHYLAASSYRAYGAGLGLLRAMPGLFGLQPRLISDEMMDLVVPLRGVAIAAGTLTILALYVFARRSFGWGAALAASTFLAVSPWHLLYSRVGLRTILAPLFAIAAVGLLLRALDSGRVRDHLLWGAAVGLGLWTYTSFRAVPIGMAIYLMQRRWRPPQGGRRAGGPLASPGARALAAGAAVAVAALLILMAFSPAGPMRYLVRGAYAALITPKADYLRNLLSATAMANRFPPAYAIIQSEAFISDGVSTVYGLIGLEPETVTVAALGTLGLLYAAWLGFAARRRSPAAALVVCCAAALLLTVGWAGPSLTRMLMNDVWLCLCAGLFLARVGESVAGLRRPLTAWLGALLVAGVLALGCVQGFNNYFLQAGRSERAMQHFGPTQTIMGMFVRSLPPGELVYVLHTRGPEVLQYLTGDRSDIHLVADATTLDLDAIIRLPRSAIFVVEYARTFAEALRYLIVRYPQGDMTQIADARLDPDKIIFYTFSLYKDASGQPIAPPGGFAPAPGPSGAPGGFPPGGGVPPGAAPPSPDGMSLPDGAAPPPSGPPGGSR